MVFKTEKVRNPFIPHTTSKVFMINGVDFTLRPGDSDYAAALRISEKDDRTATFQLRDDDNNPIEVKYRFEYKYDDEVKAYHVKMNYEETFERHGSDKFESVNRRGAISDDRRKVAAKSKYDPGAS